MKRFVSSWSLVFSVALVLFVAPAIAQQTQAPLRTPDVIFVPTPPEVVKAMLETAKVGKGDIVYDLGSGDGRIAIAAVKDFNAVRSTGIDIDPQRIKEATANLAAAEKDKPGISKNVRFLNQDLFTTDISEAVRELTQGRGVDEILDMVAGDYTQRNLDCLAADGRLGTIAVQGGAMAQINVAKLMVRRLSLTGSTLRPR